MINKSLFKQTLVAFACIGAFLNAPTSRASLAFYHVDVNTAALIGNPSGPFSVDFQFNDGSGLGDGNNTGTVGNFTYGGGGASGSATQLGGASGDLYSGVVLTDTTPFNELFQGFTAGTTLGFDVTLTTNVDPGSTPDAFSFAILDGSLANIPTTGVGDTLLLINLYPAGVNIQTGASLNPAGVIVAVPEPSSLGILTFGLILAGLRARYVGRKG